MSCIFCGAILLSETKAQHIIPSAVGGSLQTKRTTCTSCNEYFGRTIDPAFSEKYQRLLNLIPDELFQGFEAPTLKARSVSGDPLKILPGGRGESPLTTKRWEGTKLFVGAPNEKVLRKVLGQLAKGKPYTSDIDWSHEPERVHVDTSGFSPEHVRQATKISLEALGHFDPFGSSARHLREGCAAELVEFSRHGTNPASIIHKTAGILKPRSRILLNARFAALGAPSCLLPHRIWLTASDQTKQLLAMVEVLGTDLYGLILSKAWPGPSFEILYQRSVFKGSTPGWSSITTEGSHLTLAQLEDLRVKGTQGTLDSTIASAYAKTYYDIVDFRENYADQHLAEEFAFRLWQYGTGRLSASEGISVISTYLEGLFAHNRHVWPSEWPRILDEVKRTSGEMTFPESIRWDTPERLEASRILLVPLYRKYYRICRQYVGYPTNMRFDTQAS